jgi:hypothetical protein
MAVASPRPPATPTAKSLPVLSKKSEKAEGEWWVEPLKWAALAVFIAIPVLAHQEFMQPYAGRVVWTIVVAALPLFIVLVGYHRWRRICPLAFFAQIPVRLRRPGIKKASPWLEANYYYIALTIFVVSLWLRLIATNGDGHAISAFFILIAAAALLFGAFYTGKTWCNYVCPLSFIEKIYTEPHGLRETDNSQCTKCTACKKFCPDINEENGYWKEIESKPKKFAYFIFPGLVFGFYFYYYLQAGTWMYYFGSPDWHGPKWTNQPMVIHWAFLPGVDATTAGLFFLPSVPRAAAALLTLTVCGLLSFGLFSLLERLVGAYLRRRDPETDAARVRHTMFTVAAFTAFITFYSFAGQPSLRLIMPAPHFALIVVVLTATLFLVRRLRRTQKSFAEETLARTIIKRWEWTDMKPPKDLREAFLVHTIRARETAKGAEQVLEVYKDAVREALENGFVTREEVQQLEALRSQLNIKKADHEKVMAALAEEERLLLSDPTKQITAEKRLQLETYELALQNYLERLLAADSADDHLIMQLRSEYRVTKAEHEVVLDKLLGGEKGMAARLAEEISAVERAAKTIQVLELAPSPTHNFLMYLLMRRRARAIESLMRGLSFTLEGEASRVVREGLSSSDDAFRQSVVEQLQASVAPFIAERIVTSYRETAIREASMPTLTEMLAARTQSSDPYVRAISLYILGERSAASDEMLERMSNDEHRIVRETALHLKEHKGRWSIGTPRARLITIEKMVALRSAPIFSSLPPEELAELAQASADDYYDPNETLCVEGEPGNEVFILLNGEVKVLRREGTEQQLVSTEKDGSFIGEMAVLDPAPRSATLVAGEKGTHVLRLNGDAFREVLNEDPAIASGVIRTLAQRLRRQG